MLGFAIMLLARPTPPGSATIVANLIDAQTKKPFEKFSIVLDSEDEGRGDERFYGTATYAGGRAVIDAIQPGAYRIAFPNSKYVTTWQRIVLAEGEQKTLDVVVGRGATVALRVHSHGDPVSAAQVTMTPLDDPARDDDAPGDEDGTDSKGYAIFEGVPRGRWELSVEVESGSQALSHVVEQMLAVQIDGRDGARVELELDLARESGSVVIEPRPRKLKATSIELYTCTLPELLKDDDACELSRGAYADSGLGPVLFEHLEPRRYAAELVLEDEKGAQYCARSNVRAEARTALSFRLDDTLATPCDTDEDDE